MKGVVGMCITNNIMVCVTQQKTCERLINSGGEIKDFFSSDLYVIHVVKENDKFLYEDAEGDALQYLFNISKSVGAELSVLKSEDVVKTLKQFAISKNIGHIVLGEAPRTSKEGIVEILQREMPLVEFHIIPSME